MMKRILKKILGLLKEKKRDLMVWRNLRRKKIIINDFHKLYYNLQNQTWMNTYWLGVITQKCPLDLWIYQEIIFKVKPDLIIETGTAKGGCALFLASLCDLINRGEVITIDISEDKERPHHPRIKYILGSSLSKEVIKKIEKYTKDKKILVILDSNHRKEHVLKEMEFYGRLVSKNSYLIVEDTNINGHPVFSGFGPGPWEAVEEFLKKNKDFIINREREKFLLTFNPRGYLKKIKESYDKK